jgi:hypothetical protein
LRRWKNFFCVVNVADFFRGWTRLTPALRMWGIPTAARSQLVCERLFVCLFVCSSVLTRSHHSDQVPHHDSLHRRRLGLDSPAGPESDRCASKEGAIAARITRWFLFWKLSLYSPFCVFSYLFFFCHYFILTCRVWSRACALQWGVLGAATHPPTEVDCSRATDSCGWWYVLVSFFLKVFLLRFFSFRICG